MNLGIGLHPGGNSTPAKPRLTFILPRVNMAAVMGWIGANIDLVGVNAAFGCLSHSGEGYSSHYFCTGDWGEESRLAIVAKLAQLASLPPPETVPVSMFLAEINGWVGESDSSGIWGVLTGHCARMGLKVIHGRS